MAFTKSLVAAALVLAFSAAQAQTAPSTATTGTMVIVPAFGEVKHANDEATITFAVEEHDKDKNGAFGRRFSWGAGCYKPRQKLLICNCPLQNTDVFPVQGIV